MKYNYLYKPAIDFLCIKFGDCFHSLHHIIDWVPSIKIHVTKIHIRQNTMSKTTAVWKIVKFNGRFESPSTVVRYSPIFLWFKLFCNEPILRQRRTIDRKSQQHRTSRLERDIKPRIIILYVCTVDILFRIPFPLPNFLNDISPDFIRIYTN